MTLFVVALAVLLAGGVAALALGRNPRLALGIATGTGVVGSALGLVFSLTALLRSTTTGLSVPWSALNATFTVGVDPLTAFFEVALFAVAIPAVVFGAAYMRPHLGRRSLPSFLFFQNALLASIALVLAARQSVLFLVAWEGMALASFFLVTFEHEDAEVRGAGLVYLVASHLGTAFLFALFVLLARASGSFEFASFPGAVGAGTGLSLVLFVLAVVGFGTKAGLVPLHVWLPEAHPAAPSHVSALLSAVMIKTGLYGILRVLGWLPPLPGTVGLALAGLGMAGALGAIVLALGQRDLKRVLAYSSVENVGIIFLALGVAIAAGAGDHPGLAVLAWSGALLHVWNHAAMKGLAFMGAGALAHGAGTRNLESMGGLLRRLPITGGLLLIALAALSALPPFCGFASEWLVYLGLVRAAVASPGGTSLLAWLAVSGLAVVGGTAAIAFARLGGIALLGAPRSEAAARAHDGGAGLWAPLAVLAVVVLLLGLFPDVALRGALPVIAQVAGRPAPAVAASLAPTLAAFAVPMRTAATVVVAAGVALGLLVRRLRAHRSVTQSETWGCGFTRPSASMQYTASSFAQAFLTWIAPIGFRPRGRVVPPRGVLPRAASVRFESSDPARARLFDPLFRAIGDRASRLRGYQADRLNLQLVYTVATLLALAAFLVLHA